MKTEVYSWRVSSDLKADLERAARTRKVSVASVLESAVRDWLNKRTRNSSEEEEQHRLQQAVAPCIGALASGNPRRAETARIAIRQRISRRNAR